MNDFQETTRGNIRSNKPNHRVSWFNIRGSSGQVENSHSFDNFWRISWFARRTWIPAIHACTDRTGNRQATPKRLRRKQIIVDLFVAAYVLLLASGIIFTTMALAK